MTKKSRRKRGKQPSIRKAKSQQHPTTTTRIPAVQQSVESVAHPEVSPSPVAVPRQPARPQAIQHPYIATELRTISILAGIMLIVLIILYYTLA